MCRTQEPHEVVTDYARNLDILTLMGKVGDVTGRHLATLRAMLGGLSSRSARLTASEETVAFSRHREAVDFALEHLGTCSPKGVTTAQTRAVVARAFYSADRTRLVRFCDVLRTGMPTDDTDHGVIALRDFLIRIAEAGKGDSAARLRYAKTEWALDAFLDGKVPKRLCGSESELFPLPEETKPSALKLAE